MTTGTRVSTALLARIARAVVTEPQRGDSYVVQAPLTSEHVTLFQQPEISRLNDPSSVGRLVEIMKAVDCIQPSERVFSGPVDEPGYLSEVFPRVLENARFEPAPLGDSDRERLRAAWALLYVEESELTEIKTADYAEFCLQRAQLEQTENRQYELELQLRSHATPELEIEIEITRALNLGRRELLDALDALHGFRAAEDVVRRLERVVDIVPPSVKAALTALPLTRIQDPSPPNDQHVVCSFLPAQLSEDGWIPVRLTRADILAHGSAGASDGLDEDWIESIELEVQTLHCERGWLWSALFTNSNWDWSHPSAAVSGPPGAVSAIPAYVHGLVFSRNLVVRQRPGLPAAEQAAAAMRAKLEPSAMLSSMMRTPIDVIAGSRRLATPALSRAQPMALEAMQAKAAAFAVAPTTIASPQLVNARSRGMLNSKLWQAAFVKRPLAVFHGRALGASGEALRGVRVQLVSGGSRRLSSTDETGRFTFAALLPGQYRLHASHPGFHPAKLEVSLPTKKPLELRMRALANCPLRIRLVQRTLEGDRPFLGQATLVLKSGDVNRLETFAAQDTRELQLPPGSYSLSLASPEAERIEPHQRSVRLSANASRPPLTFTIYVAPTLQNPHVQLLACICKRVPPFPSR